MDWLPLLAAAVICAFGCFVQAASGFGSGLVMMGLLPFVMDARDAAVVVSLMIPVLVIHLLWKLHRHIRLRLAAPVAAGAMIVGVPLGVMIFVGSDTSVLEIMIGASLVLFSGYFLLSRREPRARGHWALGALAGTLGGVLSGACNTGGPPIVLYLYSLSVPKEDASGTLQAVFLAGSTLKITMLLLAGEVALAHVYKGAFFMACAVPGVLLGFAVFRRIDSARLRRYVYVMLVFVGSLQILTGIRQLGS